jgi:uncharacterized membrane protein
MSEKATDVMIAGYLTKDGAILDYEAVVSSGAKIDGAVCISRDLQGNTTVEQTDHMAKGGAKVLGGAGFVLGLAAPPLLAATAIGAAVGASVGKAASSKVKSQIEQEAADTIPWGGAGVIIAYPRSSADEVDKAVSHALKKVVGEAEGKKVKALKAALADAQEKAAQPAEASS